MTLVVNNFGRLQTYGNMLLVDNDQGNCVCCECHDGECPPGKKCVNGECVDGCDDRNPCPPGQICLDGQCVDKPGGNCQQCDEEDCYPVINGRDTGVAGQVVDDAGQVIEAWGQAGRDWYQFKDDTEYYVDVFWECMPDGNTRAIVTSTALNQGAIRSTQWTWEIPEIQQKENGCPDRIQLQNKTETCGPSGCMECRDTDPIPCPENPDWDVDAVPVEPDIEFLCGPRP